MINPPAPTFPPPRGARRPRPGWRRLLPWALAAGGAGLLSWGLWPAPVPVELAPVGRGPLQATVDEEGMTRVKNRYVVSAPVAGQLRRIDWKAGAVVEAGRTPLAVLETTAADFLDARAQAQAAARALAAEAARAAANAQRERARATTRMASAEFARLEKLFHASALSAQDYDAAEMRATAAREDERAAEFNLQVADYESQQARALASREPAAPGAQAEPLVLLSPVSGRILKVYQESARVVPGGFPLLEVGDPTDLEVRLKVLSRDAVAVLPGARVYLEQWGGTGALEARVRWVEPSAFTKVSSLGVEEQRVYVVADLVDPPARRPTLGDNFRVEARIVVWEGDVLHAPAGAFFQRGAAWHAFVFEAGRARDRLVQTGHANGVDTEVRDGLRAGERVIVYPGDKVGNGARVRALDLTRP